MQQVADVHKKKKKCQKNKNEKNIRNANLQHHR